MNKKIIKILIVEDSPVVTLVLKRIFSSSPELDVVGTARTGIEALELIPKVQPDVISTDLNMPQMDGLEFTQQVMMKFPRPILVLSASVQAEDTQNVFRLLAAGALDVFPKPRVGLMQDYEAFKRELINKIKILSGVSVFTQHRRRSLDPIPQKPIESKQIKSAGPQETKQTVIEQKARPTPAFSAAPTLNFYSRQRREAEATNLAPPSGHPSTSQKQVIAIGASTGGPQALHTILSQLPHNFPVPVICVQHISEGFLQGLVDWLASECVLPVKIAAMGEFPKAGVVYFPPERKHLEINSQGRFSYSAAPPVGGHCPSVTVTFESVARFYGTSAVGVLLTGMGRDGADGMLAIAQAGGLTIAQNEASCVVFGMPKEAIALGAARYILPASDIAPFLLRKVF